MNSDLSAWQLDFSPQCPMVVAYSGGADSTYLLYVCVKKWPGQVVAWHVNHHLQESALLFEKHCRDFCSSLDVPIEVISVNAWPEKGQSPEDAARLARYGAFVKLSKKEHKKLQTVLLAQHLDDQIETFFLALTRGAGLAGLRAMPRQWVKDGLSFERPLLGVSGRVIRDYLDREKIPYINDPTNWDTRYTRNKIRHELLPVLEKNFPQYLETIARSINHIGQAEDLLNDMAKDEWRKAIVEEDEKVLCLERLRALSQEKLVLVLRYWLKNCYQAIPSQAQLNELIKQIACCTHGACQIEIKVGHGYVRREQSGLYWYNGEYPDRT